MVYELWHKNINVLTVEYEPETNKFGKILSVHNEKHIPVGIFQTIIFLKACSSGGRAGSFLKIVPVLK